MIQNDKPRIIVKLRNMQAILDYCLDCRIEFTCTPRIANTDEWEVELKITDIMSAVALGMFLREHKIEPVGMVNLAPKTHMAARAKQQKVRRQDSRENEHENGLLTGSVPEIQHELPEPVEAGEFHSEVQKIETAHLNEPILFEPGVIQKKVQEKTEASVPQIFSEPMAFVEEEKAEEEELILSSPVSEMLFESDEEAFG
jgi:hypothetical protein